MRETLRLPPIFLVCALRLRLHTSHRREANLFSFRLCAALKRRAALPQGLPAEGAGNIPIMSRMASDHVELQGRQLAGTLVPVANIAGDDEKDTLLLRKMAEEGRTYIASFSWCQQVDDGYFAGGVGGIFAIFLFHVRSAHPEVDPWMWVVTGDIPSAYLSISDASSPREVFDTYIDGMRRWVKAARNGDTEAATAADVPPVDVPPTPEWAAKLKTRLDILEQVIRPGFLRW